MKLAEVEKMFKIKKYVMEVANTASFSQAADNLFISQPSLSASIKRLEEQIGEPLFDRSIHPIQLTECGQEYLRVAQIISAAEDDFVNYLDAHRNRQNGVLTLGGSNLNVTYILPPLVKEFRRQYPGVTVNMVESNIDDLHQMLLAGKVDFVIDSGKMEDDSITEYVYRTEKLLIAVPCSFACNQSLEAYRLTVSDVLSNYHNRRDCACPPLSAFEGLPFIAMTPETDTGKRTKKLFQREAFVPDTIFAFRQQTTAFNMACAELGITIISDALIKSVPFTPNLYFYKLDETDSFRFIKLYKKKGRWMTYAMQSFLHIVEQVK